jgi:hypothetical protein
MGALFDVFVVGPEQAGADPAALAAALAGRLGIAAPAVIKGLTDRKLRAGRGLETGAAQHLVRDLRGLGALAMMRPAAATDAPPAPPRPAAPPADSGEEVSVGSLPSGLSLAYRDKDTFEPPAPESAHTTPGADAFAPPGFAASPGLEMASDKPPRPGRPPAVQRPGEDAVLELDVGPRGSNDEFRRPSSTVGGATGLNVSMIAATSSASGLAVEGRPTAEAYGVRCTKHGLFFDTRKASGCTKCLEPGRKMGAAMALKARGFKLIDLDDSPVKRAFLGLAIALAMGFIPAAYHALGVGSRELRRQRAEQEMLSRRPATEEIVRRFDELDLTVTTTKDRYARNTGIIWVLVTSSALFGWYRLT